MITTEDFSHPWLRGYKIGLSFSCPDALYSKIDDFRSANRMNTSQALCRLVVLGLVYQEILDEQIKKSAPETVEAPAKKPRKKAKPKTPSK